MVKILVADSADDFCTAASDAFYGRYTVIACNDGRTALKLICAEKPDVLWLDLMLPGMDGLTILQAATLQGVHPKVIACVRNGSDYILRTLHRFSVSMVMEKSCEYSAALARLDSLAMEVLCRQGAQIATADQLTYETLLLLGLTGKRCGHKSLYTAVHRKVLQPEFQITKELYPYVAQACGASVPSVERAIRCVIADAWENSGSVHWETFFPEYPDRCPSNGVLIERLADKIREALLVTENNQPPASK